MKPLENLQMAKKMISLCLPETLCVFFSLNPFNHFDNINELIEIYEQGTVTDLLGLSEGGSE
jgi:hypothetical protein